MDVLRAFQADRDGHDGESGVDLQRVMPWTSDTEAIETRRICFKIADILVRKSCEEENALR
jgi:hypothetical protein